jgi:soluble cytochrome b562
MRLTIICIITSLVCSTVWAQEQQAGNEASTNTEETFQALIDKCDNIDALMLRAKIRLQVPRTTEVASEKAQQMLDDAFAICGEGNIDAAKNMLEEALKLAEQGATERLGADALID